MPLLCLPKPSQSHRKAHRADAGGRQQDLRGPVGPLLLCVQGPQPSFCSPSSRQTLATSSCISSATASSEKCQHHDKPHLGPHTCRYHTRRGLNHFIKPIVSLQPVPLLEPSLSIQPRAQISPAGPPVQRDRSLWARAGCRAVLRGPHSASGWGSQGPAQGPGLCPASSSALDGFPKPSLSPTHSF